MRYSYCKTDTPDIFCAVLFISTFSDSLVFNDSRIIVAMTMKNTDLAVMTLCSLLVVYIYRYFGETYHLDRATRWRSWLRHCATSRKVAGSIPDGVFGIFH